MKFQITTDIKGNRSAFGYLGRGKSDYAGTCNTADAIEILDEDRRDYEWVYTRWDNDDLIVEFERKEGANQMTQFVRLIPEVYAEFLVLKKWEKDNGFI